MKYDVELYIENRLVEFSTVPDLLLNYKQTELNSPTVVRNYFTKQIEIEGTNTNNEIFGNIWNLDRTQYYGSGGESTGAAFNPMKKAPFQLFVNGELFEKGYVKLDDVTRQNNKIVYKITLYGGLGDFFYNLSYNQDDTTNTKRTLADITYSDDDISEPEFTFKINKDEVYNAWGMITGEGEESNDRWRVINFAPCYNGIPQDFSADKVLINTNQLTYQGFITSAITEGKTYKPILNGNTNDDGYLLGELREELTEWETFDLRSYLQRPVLNLQRMVKACCQSENNGGYQVKLDSHFFNSENPYWTDVWITLPMLRDLNGEGSSSSRQVSDATVNTNDDTYWNVEIPDSEMGSLNNIRLTASFNFTPTTPSTANTLYTYHKYDSTGGMTLIPKEFVDWFEYSTALIVELMAFDSNNKVVGRSKAYMLASDGFYPNSLDTLWSNIIYEDKAPSYTFLRGHYNKNGNKYEFVDTNDNIVRLDFSFQASEDFSSLKFRVQRPTGRYIKYRFLGSSDARVSDNIGVPTLYSSLELTRRDGNIRYPDAAAIDRVQGDYGITIESFDALVSDYEGMFSNTTITKEMLLTTENTPADYLISYCKLFGLYFYRDSTEVADDAIKYPNGVVHIMDRDTFYTDEVINLEDRIDYSRKMTIIPTTSASKWYSFDLEHIDSQLNEDYKTTYGSNYGRQLVNTNYNFDNSTNELYDGNVFKSGLMAREKDKYYKKPVSGVPPFLFNGMIYKIFTNELDSQEYSAVTTTLSTWTNINTVGGGNGLDFYDQMSRLVCHTANNEASDGSGVLLFLNGKVTTDTSYGKFYYQISDDVPDMIILNDATACWIVSDSEYDGNGNRIVRKISALPNFTRDMIMFGNTVGNVVHSWNFGHPQIVFSPQVYSTDGDSIYDTFWKKYITDMYDVNSRKLSCYVKADMDGKPWNYWLRRFYWFQNSLWRLNEIKDLNMSSFEPTLMEFIKVQDMENYKLDEVHYDGDSEFTLDIDRIPATGGTVTGKVILQSAGNWFGSDVCFSIDANGQYQYYDTAELMSPSRGSGNVTQVEITFPPNTTGGQLKWKFSCEDDFDEWLWLEIYQDA